MQEAEAVQGQLQSLLSLFSSDPSLQEAANDLFYRLQDDLSSLKGEKQAIEQEIAAWTLQYQATHGGQTPTRSEWYTELLQPITCWHTKSKNNMWHTLLIWVHMSIATCIAICQCFWFLLYNTSPAQSYCSYEKFSTRNFSRFYRYRICLA